MENKNILYLIAANVLWSIIPIMVSDLFQDISIFMIIFLRFFVSGIILFVLALIFVLINNKYTSNKRIPPKQLLRYIKSINTKFFNIRNITFFAILGFFGVILNIIGYFFALKLLTISFAMVGFQISIIIVSFYEHGVKTERLDVFKMLYLIILIFSIGLITFVKINQGILEDNDLAWYGFVYIIIFTISISFLHIYINKDSYTKEELRLVSKNKFYKTPRLLLKLSLMFIIGSLILVPILALFSLFPLDTYLINEVNLFFAQFSIVFSILWRWQMLFLIFFATILTYIFIFIAYSTWNPFNLTYNQWSSILTIIEPIGAIFFGVLFAKETFPLDFLTIIIFLLVISIFLRYIHETRNKIVSKILLTREVGKMKDLALKLLGIEGIYKVDSITGTYDIIISVKTNSIIKFYALTEKINSLDEIAKIEILFLNKIHKVSS
jgi:drug/metabolite transporter (DMT)-like permease